MMTSWNKFCFTGGLIVANVSLPGASNVVGLWPAIWTLGNLGRAGYGATLEGLVRFYVTLPFDRRRAFNPLLRQCPYSYGACDVGTLPTQTPSCLAVAAIS